MRLWGDRPFTAVQVHEDRFDQPRHWRRPRRVFVCSMSDLFIREVPDAVLHRLFDVMEREERHRFMILTKRPRAYGGVP